MDDFRLFVEVIVQKNLYGETVDYWLIPEVHIYIYSLGVSISLADNVQQYSNKRIMKAFDI